MEHRLVMAQMCWPPSVENGGCGLRGPQSGEQRPEGNLKLYPTVRTASAGKLADFGGWKPRLALLMDRYRAEAGHRINHSRPQAVDRDRRGGHLAAAFGTGAMNIDACRVETRRHAVRVRRPAAADGGENGRPFHATAEPRGVNQHALGRWPANVLHDGSDGAIAAFPDTGLSSGHIRHNTPDGVNKALHRAQQKRLANVWAIRSGSAARFFYSAKADADDRIASKHPTVKPVDLMQWLVRLVTPKVALCSTRSPAPRTTGEAAWREGMRAVLIEREPEYQVDIARRMALATEGPDGRRRGIARRRCVG